MIGIDEVGRGAWAGPLVVAAVYLLSEIDGIKDSKKLSSKQRLLLSEKIKNNSVYFIESIEPDYIDSKGLSSGLSKGFNNAYIGLISQYSSLNYKNVIVDGQVDYINNGLSLAVVKADIKYSSVSAASIIAKVARDNYMIELSKSNGNYFFEKNVGYGTKQHLESIKKFGVIDGVHRKSFKPIRGI